MVRIVFLHNSLIHVSPCITPQSLPALVEPFAHLVWGFRVWGLGFRARDLPGMSWLRVGNGRQDHFGSSHIDARPLVRDKSQSSAE